MTMTSNGLVFCYDMYNTASWKGAPATNLLNQTNAYPDVGNSWGTYNTNQYNSNTYWNWGTVGSVNNNIVTFSSVSRTVYTYDVIRAQTSGGGITAGVDYLVKRWDANNFSLYTYNGAQDGALGHKVHDTVNDDNRVSINASGFPTMWWGAPHRPHAGLVKEIVPDGFTHRGRTHSCIRLNYEHRSEGGGLDGWAYGGSPPTTVGGTIYTISWYRRAVDDSAVGADPSFSMYTAGGWTLARTFAEDGGSLSRDWKRVVYKGNPPGTGGTNFYWWPSGTNSYEVSEIMFTQGLVAAEFCVGTRTNTEALLDLTGKHTITADSLTYNDDGTFEFDGVNNYITIPASSDWAFGANGTIEQWVYPRSASGNDRLWCTNNNSSSIDAYLNGSTYNVYMHGGVVGTTAALTPNAWNHIVVTYTNGVIKVYFNGTEQSLTGTTTGYNITNAGSKLVIGEYANLGGYRFDGKIPMTKIYNRGLTSEEVQENYNALRGRYGV